MSRRNLLFTTRPNWKIWPGEIEAAAGQFALMVARCNYANLRDVLVEHLRQICPVTLRVVQVTATETSLYTRILDAVKDDMPGAVMVVGLETIADLARSLATANQVREEFRKNCPFPIVFWVTGYCHAGAGADGSGFGKLGDEDALYVAYPGIGAGAGDGRSLV